MRTLLIAGLFLALAACHSKKVARYEDYPPRPPGSRVDVYVGLSATGDLVNSIPDAKIGRPPKDAQVIGQIDVSTSTSTKWGEVVRDARREARAMGGDGIILQHRSGALMSSHKVTMFVYRLPDEKPAP